MVTDEKTYDYLAFTDGLGQRLQHFRKQRGLTQEQAGAAVGVSRVYMGYIEQARKVPSMELIYNLAIIYDVPVAEFFDGLPLGSRSR